MANINIKIVPEQIVALYLKSRDSAFALTINIEKTIIAKIKTDIKIANILEVVFIMVLPFLPRTISYKICHIIAQAQSTTSAIAPVPKENTEEIE